MQAIDDIVKCFPKFLPKDGEGAAIDKQMLNLSMLASGLRRLAMQNEEVDTFIQRETLRLLEVGRTQ
jgi:hypothetical protein